MEDHAVDAVVVCNVIGKLHLAVEVCILVAGYVDSHSVNDVVCVVIMSQARVVRCDQSKKESYEMMLERSMPGGYTFTGNYHKR